MKTIKFNEVSETKLEQAIEKAIEKDNEVVSCNFDGEAFVTHYQDEDVIEWYVDTIHFNENGSIKSVDLDC